VAKMVGWIKMPLGMEVGLGPGHTVLDGDPVPPSKKGHSSPQFSAHLCCGQTAAWIKMAFGKEVGLSPGDIVLHGDTAPPTVKAQQPPNFGQCLLCQNGWMDQDTTWYRGRPWLRRHCVRWGPSSPKERGTKVPHFSAHVYCGQMVVHLSNC